MSKVEIYTKSWCPFCARAKDLLESKGVTYEETDVGHDEAAFQAMVNRSKRHTVPQIFIDGHHVGGSDDLARANREGLLDELLQGDSRAAA